jgi:hypothetical protein
MDRRQWSEHLLKPHYPSGEAVVFFNAVGFFYFFSRRGVSMALEQKAKLSSIFIWIGVLAWVPYLVLRILHKDFSVFPFLGTHIFFITGGIVLRRQASAGAAAPSQQVQRLKTVSTVLLVLGVSVWGVYFAVQWLGVEVSSIKPFLAAHLTGVLSGAGIKLFIFFSRQ